jgi:hypothetical protein
MIAAGIWFGNDVEQQLCHIKDIIFRVAIDIIGDRPQARLSQATKEECFDIPTVKAVVRIVNTIVTECFLK